MSLRKTGPEDAPILTALHQASLAPGWSLAQMHGSLALATTCGWLAERNGRAEGFILCQALPDQAEILTLAVVPESRRAGVATAILAAAIDGLRKRSVQLWLEVAEDNVAALRLYEKSGFIITGRRPNYYQRAGGTADAMLMTRKL